MWDEGHILRAYGSFGQSECGRALTSGFRQVSSAPVSLPSRKTQNPPIWQGKARHSPRLNRQRDELRRESIHSLGAVEAD